MLSLAGGSLTISPTDQTLLPSLLFTTSADTPFPSTPTDANLPPGTLDLTKYEFSDAKLGIVFESAEMVRSLTPSEVVVGAEAFLIDGSDVAVA